MKHYKDQHNEVFAYEDEQMTCPMVIEAIANMTEITKEEADALSNPPPTLSGVKENKTSEINTSCENAILNGFWYKPSWQEKTLLFSFNIFDQTNFLATGNQINLAFIAGKQDTLPNMPWNGWEDEAKTKLVVLDLDYTKFIELDTYANVYHKAALMSKAGDLKIKVQNATTVEEIQQIKW